MQGSSIPSAIGGVIPTRPSPERAPRPEFLIQSPAATRLVQLELRSERGTVDVDRLSLREARPVS